MTKPTFCSSVMSFREFPLTAMISAIKPASIFPIWCSISKSSAATEFPYLMASMGFWKKLKVKHWIWRWRLKNWKTFRCHNPFLPRFRPIFNWSHHFLWDSLRKGSIFNSKHFYHWTTLVVYISILTGMKQIFPKAILTYDFGTSEYKTFEPEINCINR